MTQRAPELEMAYERINQLEDLLGEALDCLDGVPGYANTDAIRAEIRAYFDERRKRRVADGETAPERKP